MHVLNEKILKEEFKNFKTTPADGPIVAINALFVHGIASIKVKKIQEQKEKIIIIWNGIESISNTKTLKYLLEGLIFFGLIDFKTIKEKSFTKYINNIKEGEKEVFFENTSKYSTLNDYFMANKEHIMDYIYKNLNKIWNQKPFFNNILIASHEAYTNDHRSKRNKAQKYKIKYTYSGVYEILFLNSAHLIKNTPYFLKKDELMNLEIKISNEEKEEIKRMLLENDEKLEKNQNIRRLRRLFKSRLVTQVIKDYSKEMNENTLLKSFPILEGAHIVSVKELILNDEIEEISNHNNGFLIDPNLHKMFDMNKVKIQNEEDKVTFVDSDGNTWGAICSNFISKERRKWINRKKSCA